MRDLQELAAWFQTREVIHDDLTPSTLPDPSFVSDGRRFVSFSSNNYLALVFCALAVDSVIALPTLL